MINKETVLNFLQKNKLGTLATVTKEGKPHADAVYYFIDDNFDVFFLTKNRSQKYKNIQHHHDVVMVVTDLQKKVTAKINGIASPEADKNLLTVTMNSIARILNQEANFDQVLPILKRDDGELLVIKIKILSIRYSDYGPKELQERTFVF